MDLNLITVFIAGVISFLSPCFLPLLPSFLSYITGTAISDSKNNQLSIFLHSLSFILGFSLVFILVGGAIGHLGKQFIIHQNLLQLIGGSFVILLGVYMMDWLKIPWLQAQHRIALPNFIKKLNYLRSFFIGFFFAFGWSPCYGPIIGAVLTLVASQASFWTGIYYFSIYSLGFAIPFLSAALFINQFILKSKKFHKLYKYSSCISGTLLIIIGLLILTNNISYLVSILGKGVY